MAKNGGVVCPSCKVVIPMEDPEFPDNASVGCEDCGDHSAFLCPECDEIYDLVFYDLEVVYAS